MDVGILVTIRSLLPNLAPVERRVAQAVLDDPGGAARQSISELSRSCGTSATTVVLYGGSDNRFAAAAFWLLRYLGFPRVALLNGGDDPGQLSVEGWGGSEGLAQLVLEG